MIDDTTIVSIHMSEEIAELKAQALNMNKKASYYHYYVEDHEVEEW